MSTDRIIALFIAERNRLEAAIQALQGPLKRRDRLPKSSAPTDLAAAPAPRKRTMSAAGRKAVGGRSAEALGVQDGGRGVIQMSPYRRHP
jgi:hypothetical protein